MKTKRNTAFHPAILLIVALAFIPTLPRALAQLPPEKLAELEKQIEAMKQTVDELRQTPPAAAPASGNRGSSARRSNDPISRIREEGLERSKVAETLSYLTDVIGPRLTGSPNLKRGSEWTRDKLASWGLTNAQLEPWGQFGRGWSLKRFSAQVIEPHNIPLIGFPKAWSPGLDQPIEAEVVYIDANTEADLEKYKGKLKDAVVLTAPVRQVAARFDPLATRRSDTNLLSLANAGPPGAARAGGRGGRGGGREGRGGRGAAAPAGPYLGITGEDATGGVRLTSVPEDSPAARAGLKANDLVLAVSSKPIDRYDQLVEAINSARVGDKLNLKFQRENETRQVEATLAARPAAAGGRGNLPGRILTMLLEEKAALAVGPSSTGDGGTVFVQSVTLPGAGGRGGAGANGPRYYSTNAPATPPQMTLAVEDYNRLVRMIKQGEKLKMAVEMKVQFHDEDLMAYNISAEIPGSDLKDEVVMLGGHFDSWQVGTGATDNAAGVVAAMEAVRIIAKLDLKPRRTIRIGLWTGEEQGLLGSRAYVSKHFGYYTNTTDTAATRSENQEGDDAAAAQPAPGGGRGRRTFVRHEEYDKFSTYFNLDNGTGKIRGVYMQGNEAVRPIFRRWLEPFGDLGASTLTVSNTGSTDHVPFDDIGLPGFQFIQDTIEYSTRTHHSTADVFDRIQVDDLKQAAVIMATFAYNAAMLDEKLPRKPRE